MLTNNVTITGGHSRSLKKWYHSKAWVRFPIRIL